MLHFSDYKKYFASLEIFPVNYSLKVVTGEKVKIIGEIDIIVEYNEKSCCLPLVILDSFAHYLVEIGRIFLIQSGKVF